MKSVYIVKLDFKCGQDYNQQDFIFSSYKKAREHYNYLLDDFWRDYLREIVQFNDVKEEKDSYYVTRKNKRFNESRYHGKIKIEKKFVI